MSIVNKLIDMLPSEDVIDLYFIMSDLVDIYQTDTELCETASMDSLATETASKHTGEKHVPIGKQVF